MSAQSGNGEQKRRGARVLWQVWRVVWRAVLAALALWLAVVFSLPLASPRFVQLVEVPLAVFILIVYIGTLLYDTFFYEHYRR